MAFPRKALFLALLVLTPLTAGCNVKDWYNQNGTVTLELNVLGPKNTSLDNLRSVKVAIYGATVRQFSSADARHFTYPTNDPKIVDLVQKGKDGERVPIANFKISIRAVESVTVRMEVFEAIDAAGNALEICRLRDKPERFPCFFIPDNSAYQYYEKPFAPPRGGEVVVGFPLAIKYAARGRVSEYYISTPAEEIVLENRR